MKTGTTIPPLKLRPCQTLRWVISGLVFVHYIQPAQAENLTPVPGGALVSREQGVPVVGIVAPNAAGVSHNQFYDYNVERQGLVLNNSLVPGTSQLAGQLGANAQFNGRDASLILNEVISRNASSIAGAQEIFGRSADYVLANPNGINVNGASFINTPRASFVVGSPELEDGRLTRLNTFNASGDLQVGKLGLHNNGGAIDLLAPRITTEGEISAQATLNLTAGRNQVNYASGSVEQSRNSPGSSQRVDAQLFGAMRAGRINIISTADGAGVRIAAPVTSRADLRIESAGDLEITGKTRPNNLNVQRTVLSSTEGDARLSAKGDLTLKAADVNGRNIDAVAGRNLRLDALSGEQTTESRDDWEKKFWFITTETYDKKHTETRRRQHGSQLNASADVHLKAGENVEFKASGAKAGGQLQVDAGKDLLITALNDSSDIKEKVSHRKNLWRGDYEQNEHSEKAQGSHLQSAAAMNLTAKGNVQVQGSQVESTGDMTIQAGGKVEIGASRVAQSSYKKNYEGDLVSGSFFGQNGKDDKSKDQAIGSRVEAQGTLHVISEEVTISGSRVLGKQDALLISNSGALTIDGAQNLEHSDKSDKDSKLFGLIKDQTRTQNDSGIHVGSQVQSQSNLRLQSASDLNVIGAEIKAQDKLELTANNDINLRAAQSSQKTIRETDTHGFTASAGETKKAADGIKGSKQYKAEVGYNQKETNNTLDTLSHERSQLSGGTVEMLAGNNLQVKGSQVEASAGDLTLKAKSIELLSEADKTTDNTLEKNLSLGAFATGGMDRAGTGFQVGKERIDTNAKASTVTSSQLNARDNLKLIADNGQGTIITEAARVKAGKDLVVSAASVENRAAHDSKSETRDVNKWTTSLGASLEYKDVTRPIQKMIEDTGQSKFYQPLAIDAIETPNVGADLAFNLLDTKTGTDSTKAVVSEFEGAAVKVAVEGALTDTGTRYTATEGQVAITADSHEFLAAEDTTNTQTKGTDVDASLRVYTSTGSDINARAAGAGGSFELAKTTSTAVPGSLSGKQGIQIQLGADGRYEGTRFDAQRGALSIHSPGSLTFDEARDRQTSSEKTLGGFAWLEGGTSPTSGKKANGGFQLDKSDLRTEDTQGRGATLHAKGLTDIVAGQDLTLHGAQIGDAKNKNGEVNLSGGNSLEFLAGVDTHEAQGSKIGGGARLSFKATQTAESSTNGGGIGAQFSLGKTDESSQIKHGGSINSAGKVHVEAENVRLQGLQGKAQAFELVANNGDLILESATSIEKRDNKSIGVGLGINATGSSDSANNASGLFGRAKLEIDKLDSQTHDNTRLTADRVQLDSRGDTRLTGATIDAKNVSGQIDGDLLVESRQDQVKGLTVKVDAQLTTEKNPNGVVDKVGALGGPAADTLKDKTKGFYEKATDKAKDLKNNLVAKVGDAKEKLGNKLTRSDRYDLDKARTAGPAPSSVQEGFSANASSSEIARSRLKDLFFKNPRNRDITPTLLVDVSHTSKDSVAQASSIKGIDKVDLQVGGNVNLIGARITSTRGSVDLGGASVNAKDLNSRDYRADVGLNTSTSVMQSGTEIIKELLEKRDSQTKENELFNIGLLRGGGHNQSQSLASGIDQKTR
jgi:hemolysin